MNTDRDTDKLIFKSKHNKPRQELSLPQLAFHHADHWMRVLGMEVFSAWLMIYTWCDRAMYPQDDISHHKDIREVAQAFGCGVNKAQKIIQTLYEFGLIEIIQEKNKFGSLKNVYYWYEIPVYADSMYCELKRFRSWSDRNWHGQELARLSKIKEEKKAITSRIQNEYGSDNPQENSGLPERPYSKSIRQPYSKQIQYNDLNNNNIVVVEDKQPDKEVGMEVAAGMETIPQQECTIREIQEVARSNCNADLPDRYVAELLKKYSAQYIKRKIEFIGTCTGRIKNLPGFLFSALRDDYAHIPGRPARKRPGQGNSKTGRAGPKKKHAVQKRKPPDQYAEMSERKRELIKRLYLS